MRRSCPGVSVGSMQYSHIPRPQLGHSGNSPTGCLGGLNKSDCGIGTPSACLITPLQIITMELVPALEKRSSIRDKISVIPAFHWSALTLMNLQLTLTSWDAA